MSLGKALRAVPPHCHPGRLERGGGRSWNEGQAHLQELALRDSKWKSEAIKDGESLFIGWAAARWSVISEKLKLDSRARICFPDIFPLDFSKCVVGVS